MSRKDSVYETIVIIFLNNYFCLEEIYFEADFYKEKIIFKFNWHLTYLFKINLLID